ncbi:hypothetical protein [Fredinandcohnia quinoae]|uniref:Uncharacterized protein n=1 Tax=Fredinandcohnia quinoae TaxID=2918902 RepID=A0AAW5E5D6_9BACI|nr:hypothetical protein [Fredinandcohnia sp. SECRCQ15]MCH1627728.1 hypothetical protein [Fredinandcohnia sp. SECRCQ15]
MMLDAWFSGTNLLVQEQGEKTNKSYSAVDKEELDEYAKMIQDELENAIYHSEEKEKARIREFFSDLRSVYGYLYTAENGSFQVFLKIDEALLEGEVSGSLSMMTETGNQDMLYEETKYEINGITDGMIIKLYTKVDGNETKLEGNFHQDAYSFDLSFWTTDDKLTFYAVTEAEFKRKFGK